MDGLFLLKLPILQLLMIVFYATVVAQVTHFFFLCFRRSHNSSLLTLLYEVFILMHLLLAAALSCAAMSNSVGLAVLMWFGAMPLEPLMWIHCVACAMGIAVAFQQKRIALLGELIILLFSVPVIIELLGPYYPFVFMIDAAYFAFREGVLLAGDLRALKTSTSSMSLLEAVRMLPEGILYYTKTGKVVLANDAMRACLTALGYPTDLADARSLQAELQERACVQSEAGLTVELPTGEVRLFSFDTCKLKNEVCTRVAATDITEEHTLNAELAKTNALLEATGIELRASMEQLKGVEEAEARVRMRQRIHDVIGQRLSILRQYTHDRHLRETNLTEVTELIASMKDDLACSDAPCPSETLNGIIAAFGLVAVTVDVSGSLPHDEDAARVCVDIIREAITNAVRHAQAKEVWVSIAQDEGGITQLEGGATQLVIHNTGETISAPLREGCGIAGMRKAVALRGGELSIAVGPPFTVSAIIR